MNTFLHIYILNFEHTYRIHVEHCDRRRCPHFKDRDYYCYMYVVLEIGGDIDRDIHVLIHMYS